MSKYRYIPTISLPPFLRITIPCLIGWVMIKPVSARLYSERYGGTPNVVIGCVSISWINYGGGIIGGGGSRTVRSAHIAERFD